MYDTNHQIRVHVTDCIDLYSGDPLGVFMIDAYEVYSMLLDHFLRNPYVDFARFSNFSPPVQKPFRSN